MCLYFVTELFMPAQTRLGHVKSQLYSKSTYNNGGKER